MTETVRPSLEERLVELETRLGFVDDLTASLNATVAAHEQRLHQLHNAVLRLREELVAARNDLASARDARDEPPPPHY